MVLGTSTYREQIGRSLISHLEGRDGEESVHEDLANIVAEVVGVSFEEGLGLDPDEIIPTARVAGDLEAESIDYLDIIYRIESGLSRGVGRIIGIFEWDLFGNVYLGKDCYNGENELTDRGMRKLKNEYSHITDTLSEEDRRKFERTRRQTDLLQAQNVLSVAVFAYDLCKKKIS